MRIVMLFLCLLVSSSALSNLVQKVIVRGWDARALPGATVTVTSPNNQVSQVTNSSGVAEIGVPPGAYSIKVELAGFQSVTRKNLAFKPGNNSDIVITLKAKVP